MLKPWLKQRGRYIKNRIKSVFFALQGVIVIVGKKNMNTSESIYETIDKSKDEMIALQRILTAIPALDPSSGGKGELQKCLALEKWLREKGIENLERFDAPDARADSGIRPNLIATLPGKKSQNLWIMTHLDVVPTGDLSLWNSDPWEMLEKDGKLYGRGTEDNQQGLVSSIFALKALLANKQIPEYTVKLLFVADEEVGSTYGIQYLLENHALFQKDDLIIIPDGGDSEGLCIEIAEKNILWFQVKTLGKQCHGSRPDEGINAHLAACDLALLLHDMENHFSAQNSLFEPVYSTFEPTKKEANVPNINTIPGEDSFFMDCRILPQYSLDEVRLEIEKRTKSIEKKYGVEIAVEEKQAVESPATPHDAEVVQVLKKAIQKLRGKEARLIGIGGGTVASYLRNEGLHAAVWSTLDETAHQPNEYCRIENMIEDAKVLASIMLGNN